MPRQCAQYILQHEHDQHPCEADIQPERLEQEADAKEHLHRAHSLRTMACHNVRYLVAHDRCQAIVVGANGEDTCKHKDLSACLSELIVAQKAHQE